jgi:hypothetical protein
VGVELRPHDEQRANAAGHDLADGFPRTLAIQVERRGQSGPLELPVFRHASCNAHVHGRYAIETTALL